MCADDVSPRGGRATRGKHRKTTGTLRMVDGGTGSWSLVPATRSTHVVGRVGALAIALGIGVVIGDLPAIAAADPDSANTTGPTQSSGSRHSTTGTAKPRAGLGPRTTPRPIDDSVSSEQGAGNPEAGPNRRAGAGRSPVDDLRRGRGSDGREAGGGPTAVSSRDVSATRAPTGDGNQLSPKALSPDDRTDRVSEAGVGTGPRPRQRPRMRRPQTRRPAVRR